MRIARPRADRGIAPKFELPGALNFILFYDILFYMMDERKKTIAALEEKKKEAGAVLNGTYKALGESLVLKCRKDGGELPVRIEKLAALVPESHENYIAYCRLGEKITKNKDAVLQCEEHLQASLEIDKQISEKEIEQRKTKAELALLHLKLGKLAMEDPGLRGTAPNRAQYTLIEERIAAKEKKLGDIAEQTNANFFRKLGNAAQSLTARALLSRDKDALDGEARTAGEYYAANYTGPLGNDANSALGDTFSETLFMQKLEAEIDNEIRGFKIEKQKHSEVWHADGTANKKIERLNSEVAHYHNMQNDIYILLGKNIDLYKFKCADANILNQILSEEEILQLEKIQTIKNDIAEFDNQITKLNASLLIDEERAAIAKLERSIQALHLTIAASEEKISRFEEDIKEANERISKLESM